MDKKKAKLKKKASKSKAHIAELGKPYRWKPGQSGNPSGKPKGHRTVAMQFRKQFDLPANILIPVKERAIEIGINPDTATVGDIFALSVIMDAISGKESMVREVINRMDGKVPDIIRSEIIEEAKATLDNLTDEQLKAMLRKELKKENGNDNKKANSRRISKKKSG